MTVQPYQLVMRSGPTPGKAYPLSKTEIYIGRDVSNDIAVNDAELSRKHARLTQQEDTFVVEDLGSTNGTFVDAQRLMGPHVLKPGELIMFGENVGMVFEAVAYDPNATIMAAVRWPSRHRPRVRNRNMQLRLPLPCTPGKFLPAQPKHTVHRPRRRAAVSSGYWLAVVVSSFCYAWLWWPWVSGMLPARAGFEDNVTKVICSKYIETSHERSPALSSVTMPAQRLNGTSISRIEDVRIDMSGLASLGSAGMQKV